MTDQARAVQRADDAELLNMVRVGDSAAFQILRQRHEYAARRLARDLVATVSDVDDVVAETFAQLLEATQLGGGPSDAFRPYVLTALRQVCDERAGMASQLPVTSSGSLAEAGETASASLIARAFLSLPERWIAVLWHAEIEESGPAEIAPLLGLTPGAVAALRRQAKDSLRRAYLQIYTSEVARPECAAAAVRLGAFIRDAVSGPDSAMVTEHLSQCDDCRAVFAELSDVSMPLRAVVAPVFLGDSAGYYLSGSAGARTEVVPVPLAAVAGVAAARTAGRSGTVRHSGRQLRWIAAGGITAIAAGAVVFAFSLAGNSTPVTAGGESQAETSPTTAATFAQPSAAGARSASGRVVVPVSASRGHSTPAISPSSPQRSPDRPGRRPGGSTSPTPSPTPSTALVRLAASVDVYSGHHWQGATVVFQVSDTGSGKTGTLTVLVVLPPGSGLISWGHGHGHDGNHGGWSCRATSSGASCTRNPIQPGSQSQGTILIGIGGPSACGRPVSVTATSGSATARAQSAQVLAC